MCRSVCEFVQKCCLKLLYSPRRRPHLSEGVFGRGVCGPSAAALHCEPAVSCISERLTRTSSRSRWVCVWDGSAGAVGTAGTAVRADAGEMFTSATSRGPPDERSQRTENSSLDRLHPADGSTSVPALPMSLCL
ncbi:hypothetical protein Q8A67_019088 [Cirrhinus molitorella]|uniref:Uncharacterized protein n=1 Tax=Cirrhinus molitorella TaxID=172907 RepID=A0AA88PD68_9TELE|nr:hypothetical protein Q8A67_019088 [Cirrhinus molitorella]